MILLVWTTSPDKVDDYVAHETMAEAKAAFKLLLDRDDVYSASICGVIDSTDYEPYEEK